MKKQGFRWLDIIASLAGVSALVLIAGAAMLVWGRMIIPLAPVTPSPAATLTMVPSLTPTADWVATREYIKTLVPEATAIRPTGIFPDTTDFFHEGYQMQNAWQQQVNGSWAAVFAGARQDDPQQGVIFTQWEIPNASIGHFMNTPVRAGSVRITAEQNDRLTLQAADGTTFYFDVPAQAFVTSLTEVVPTITPPPTFTPTPVLPTPCGGAGYPAPCATATLNSYPAPTAQATVAP